MRILWVSNAPWAPSGYGEQAALFVPRLQAAGHDVAVMCNFGLQGAKFEMNGTTYYPADNQWGNRTMHTYAADHKADLIIVLHDAWVLTPDAWPADGPPVAVWAPIDHYPIPPAVLAVLTNERIRPIAMSRFGEKQMDAFGMSPAYVPHGVDTNVFRPRPEIRDTIRDELGVPRDAFLVGMVSANKGNPATIRKSFDKAFLAFAQIAKRHDDAWLYCHTEAAASPSGGIDLDVLSRASGAPPERLRFPNEQAWHLGMNNQVVMALYNAFDVLLMPSMGEGFGVPLIEAQACGCPVIASDHSAMSELAGKTGWLVEGDPVWDALQTSWFISPFVASITACLENAYAARGNLDALSAAAVAFAADYDADVVAERFWTAALEHVTGAREIPPLAAPSRQVRRAQERQAAKANA